MDAGASASARPAGLPVHDARPVGCAHPASRARPAGAASHSRKGAGRGLDRPLAASAAGPRCLVRSQRHEGLGVLTVWHDERASYEAVLGPRPYKRRPVQVIRVGQRLWQGFVPAMFDLFGERVPDHVCLHLVRRWDNPQPGSAFVPLGRNSEDILDACDETHGPSIPRVIDIDKE